MPNLDLDQCYEITGTTYADYLQFCKLMSVNQSDKESKTLFFKMILENRLIKDTTVNSLIIKGE